MIAVEFNCLASYTGAISIALGQTHMHADLPDITNVKKSGMCWSKAANAWLKIFIPGHMRSSSILYSNIHVW